MGKNDFLTPKAIANKIKAKGLQKLRWYCQMCQKQCRDENGFKCHCMSESHQHQMEIFGQNPNRIVGGYSEEFERLFLEHMKRSHRFSRVAATVVYNEYIADRHHVHMNSTQWATLTEFVKYLGKTQKCEVEETSKGWFITYIDQVLKEKKRNKRIRANLADEEKQEREIKKQREQLINIDDGTVELLWNLEAHEQKIKLTLSSTSKSMVKKRSGCVFDEIEDKEKRKKGNTDSGKRDVLDEIMREEEKERERSNRKDYWLCVGIIVKVMSKSQKGIVRKVIDKYFAEIEMIETKHVLRVHQEELQTVIPQIGGLVRIVNGAYRATNARLLAVNANNFCAEVQIESGIYDGKVLKAIDYEDISKCY